jgi:hypothetical protein
MSTPLTGGTHHETGAWHALDSGEVMENPAARPAGGLAAAGAAATLD